MAGCPLKQAKNEKADAACAAPALFLFDFCLIKQKSERPSSLSLVCCVRSLFCLGTGNVLFSRAVSSQVHSALRGLTSVFGMGTGVSLLLSSPVWLSMFCTKLSSSRLFFRICDQALDLLVSVSSTHYCAYTPDLSPCSLQGVLLPYDMGYLILRWVSRLDAFSVYPFRTSLPCYAAGATTGAQ